MIQIKILNKEGQELFSAKDTAIDVVYNGEYNDGDKIESAVIGYSVGCV